MRIKYTILACLFISSTIVGQTVSKVGTTAAQFLKIGIGYRIVGGTKFYERAEIKDLVT